MNSVPVCQRNNPIRINAKSLIACIMKCLLVCLNTFWDVILCPNSENHNLCHVLMRTFKSMNLVIILCGSKSILEQIGNSFSQEWNFSSQIDFFQLQYIYWYQVEQDLCTIKLAKRINSVEAEFNPNNNPVTCPELPTNQNVRYIIINPLQQTNLGWNLRLRSQTMYTYILW